MNTAYKKIDYGLPLKGVSLDIPQKDKILSHLRSGDIVAAAAGRALDIITGTRIPDEWVIFTDGEYQWDTSLIYHFDKYNILLPDEFIEHVTNIKTS